jgi:hypothetical protein
MSDSTKDKVKRALIVGGVAAALGMAVVVPGAQLLGAVILPTLQAGLGTVVAGVGTVQAPIIAPVMSFVASGFGTGTTALVSTSIGLGAGLLKGSAKKEDKKGSDKSISPFKILVFPVRNYKTFLLLNSIITLPIII